MGRLCRRQGAHETEAHLALERAREDLRAMECRFLGQTRQHHLVSSHTQRVASEETKIAKNGLRALPLLLWTSCKTTSKTASKTVAASSRSRLAGAHALHADAHAHAHARSYARAHSHTESWICVDIQMLEGELRRLKAFVNGEGASSRGLKLDGTEDLIKMGAGEWAVLLKDIFKKVLARATSDVHGIRANKSVEQIWRM